MAWKATPAGIDYVDITQDSILTLRAGVAYQLYFDLNF